MPRPLSWSGREPHITSSNHHVNYLAQPNNETTQTLQDTRRHPIHPTRQIPQPLRQPTQVHNRNPTQPNPTTRTTTWHPRHANHQTQQSNQTTQVRAATRLVRLESAAGPSAQRYTSVPYIPRACESPTACRYERDLTSHCIMPGRFLSGSSGFRPAVIE